MMTEQDISDFVTRVAAEKEAELATLRGRVRELEAQLATASTATDAQLRERLAHAEEVTRTAQAELDPLRADRSAVAQRLDATLKHMELALVEAIEHGATHAAGCAGGMNVDGSSLVGDPCGCWVGVFARIARDM